MPNDFELRGRAEKVAAIVEQVEFRAAADGLDVYGDAEEIARRLRGYDDLRWEELQQAAGYMRKKAPSHKTRQGVIATFERRVDVEREIERLDADSERLRALTRELEEQSR